VGVQVEVPLQDQAVTHVDVAGQLTGLATQEPAPSQASPQVQALPSLQEVPQAWSTSSHELESALQNQLAQAVAGGQEWRSACCSLPAAAVGRLHPETQTSNPAIASSWRARMAPHPASDVPHAFRQKVPVSRRLRCWRAPAPDGPRLQARACTREMSDTGASFRRTQILLHQIAIRAS
jgi:hypothetical protein